MSDYLDPNNQELLKDFFAEARSQVDALEQNILVLENDPANRDAVDEIFRAAHTLKGGAGTVEMHELTAFTHVVEDLLDAIRSDLVKVDADVIDSLLAGIDIIKAMLDSRSDGKPYTKDISSQKAVLAAFIPGKNAPKAAAKPAAKAPATSAAPKKAAAAAVSAGAAGLTEYEILEMKEAAGADRTVYILSLEFDEENVMNTVSAIHAFAAIRDVGSVLKTVPDFEKLYEDMFHPKVDYYLATQKTVDELERIAMIPDVVKKLTITQVGLDGQTHAAPAARVEAAPARAEVPQAIAAPAPETFARPSVQPPAPVQPPLEQIKDSNAEEAMAAEAALASEDKHVDQRRQSQNSGSILRVDSRRIDNLLNLVSETVINKATFNQISSQFTELQSTFQTSQNRFRDELKDLFDSLPEYLKSIEEGRTIKDVKKEVFEKYGGLYTVFDGLETDIKTNVAKFRSTAQNLGRITSELQEGVMRIRMVPISQIFGRFPRLVRDLSKNLNKKVNLVIEGEDTELDKSVIEDLLDPLMHAVRNALDHGIEKADERKAAGKPEEGTVVLRASNEGNMILIDISDDGKGIDVDSVRRKAVERGLIHPNKALTELESFNLIFEPGFSTAASITNISGRGVGLDVVKRQIEKLNGTVTVSSQHGKGTRFTIKLPLTLAIIQGLLVRVGREIYSIPITSVIESHRIKPSDIKMIDNYEVFNVRSDVVSLLRLNRLFRIQTNEQSDYCFVVIVGTNEKRVGLMVDSLIGEEDVVIKPLHDQFTNSPGIAGASILGDGSVCLIIDVSQLLELGQKKELEERQRLEMTIR
ncbi:MAG: chemotaxis protein CheA [Spirochaetes bacterium]|nr:chemotaxis protein CheA [Spirochaetota bacterium]MBU0954979.1 chemotaxis protein CheA [Spirochaetota bacterium]